MVSVGVCNLSSIFSSINLFDELCSKYKYVEAFFLVSMGVVVPDSHVHIDII